MTFGRPWGGPTSDHPGSTSTGRPERGGGRAPRALGHRRVAFVGWPQGSGVGDDRRAGWEAAVSAPAPPGGARRGLGRGRRGSRARSPGRGSCSRRPSPTALVCASDSLAVGAVRRPRGPRSVAGFDDAPVAEPLGLTSLRQPLESAARHCLELVLHPTTPRGARGAARPPARDPNLELVTPATPVTTRRRVMTTRIAPRGARDLAAAATRARGLRRRRRRLRGGHVDRGRGNRRHRQRRAADRPDRLLGRRGDRGRQDRGRRLERRSRARPSR